jgi:hypothetical protein
VTTIESASQIPSLSDLGHEEFDRDYYRRSRPFVVRGGARAWPAFARWSPEHLRARFGDRIVKVAINRRGAFDYARARQESMPFHHAADLIHADRPDGEIFHYVQQRSIPVEFPELLADLQVPRWIDRPDWIAATNLWYGGAGNVTPLHFDRDNNFYAQLRGRKHLTLFDPSHFLDLYPDLGSALSHISRVDLLAPDYASFPALRATRSIEVLLEPGDLLYLPPYWWHLVRSLDEAISINYWWRPHLVQCLCMAPLYYLPEAHEAGVLREEIGKLDTRGFAGLDGMARYFLANGYAWAAAFLAAAALDEALESLCRRLGIAAPPPGGARIEAAVAVCERAAGPAGGVMDGGALARLRELLARAGGRGEVPVDDGEVEFVLRRAQALAAVPVEA